MTPIRSTFIAITILLIALRVYAEAPRSLDAKLRVKWSDAAAQGRLSLIPVDVTLARESARQEAIAAWQRPVNGTEQTWTALPAGTYRIVFLPSAETSSPRDVGDVVLAAADDRTIEIKLPAATAAETARTMTGAAVAIRILASTDLRPLGGVTVAAIRAHHVATARSDGDLEKASIAKATTNSGGWARLHGLPEENVVFVVRQPGRANPHFTEPYRFARDEEIVLEDILLDPPANLFVTVALPEHLSGTVELSRVELEPVGHTHRPRAMPISTTITAGAAIVEDVPAGIWRVRAAGRLKDGFALSLTAKDIEVFPAAHQQVTLEVNDSLYRGRVTRNGEAVSGSISLKPADRRSGRRSAVAALAADGSFQVLLEGDGEYFVRVQEMNHDGVAVSGTVKFEQSAREVAIELPDGRIRGRIVDGAGSPVGGASVHATQQLVDRGGQSGTRSGRDGTFTLESIARGMWLVAAETAEGKSEGTPVSYDSAAVEDITLVVEPIRTVRIRLLDSDGTPIAEGLVSVGFPRAHLPATDPDVQSTDREGYAKFRFKRSQVSAPVNVVVITPDRRLSCAVLQLDRDHILTAAAATGELKLVRQPLAAGAVPWLVSASGCSVPFLGVRSETDAAGTPVTVFPRLASGVWTYVEARAPEEFAAVVTGRGQTLPPRVKFTVEPNRTTRAVVAQSH